MEERKVRGKISERKKTRLKMRKKQSGCNRKAEEKKAEMERRRRGGLAFSSRFPRPDHMKEIAEEDNKCRCLL
jgi:hypothetical protein